jgi:hypothetical protein
LSSGDEAQLARRGAALVLRGVPDRTLQFVISQLLVAMTGKGWFGRLTSMWMVVVETMMTRTMMVFFELDWDQMSEALRDRVRAVVDVGRDVDGPRALAIRRRIETGAALATSASPQYPEGEQQLPQGHRPQRAPCANAPQDPSVVSRHTKHFAFTQSEPQCVLVLAQYPNDQQHSINTAITHPQLQHRFMAHFACHASRDLRIAKT